LTSYLLAHRFHSPFKRALQDRCLQYASFRIVTAILLEIGGHP
jgi:hypothetical protein